MKLELNVSIVKVQVVVNKCSTDQIFFDMSEEDSRGIIGDYVDHFGAVSIHVESPKGRYQDLLDHFKVDEYEVIDVVSGKLRKGARVEKADGAHFSEAVVSGDGPR